jgi:sugar lactone lactonase YvrE
MKTLMTGIAMGESPRWHDGRLWFSDWKAGEVIAVDLDGTHEVIATVDSFPFSIDWLPDGRLLVVDATHQRLLRSEGDDLITHVELPFEHGCNEIVVDGRGTTYLNNIGFEFPGGEVAPGFVVRVTPDREVSRVDGDLMFPNGMVVTPDNATLIVAESYGRCLTAFDIANDGSLSDRRKWADLGEGTPDGLTLDADGAVWYADVPNQRCVRVAEGGEVLDTVDVGRACFACMLGGPDGRTLFIVAADWPGVMEPDSRTSAILSVDAPAPRAGWPR